MRSWLPQITDFFSREEIDRVVRGLYTDTILLLGPKHGQKMQSIVFHGGTCRMLSFLYDKKSAAEFDSSIPDILCKRAFVVRAHDYKMARFRIGRFFVAVYDRKSSFEVNNRWYLEELEKHGEQ